MGRRSEGWKLLRDEGSPFWYVRFTTPQGRRFKQSTGYKTKSEAAGEAARIYAEVVSSPEGTVGRGPHDAELATIFAEWLEEIDTIRSEGWGKQLEMYVTSHWMPRWKWSSELTSQAIQKYIGERLKTVSTVTLQKELSGLRTFLRWCKRNGHVSEVPAWDAPKPVSDYQPLCLSREEVAAVLAELPTWRTHPKRLPVREYFTVMWATSFRRGTMGRIIWDDVDLDKGVIVVRSSADKKRFGRTVPLTPEAVEALEDLKERTAGGKTKQKAKAIGLVFGLRDFRTSVRNAAERAGLPARAVEHLANHSFRHSRLTDLASRTSNIAAIQHMAGHKDLASTMRYVHASEENARRMLEEIGDGRNSGRIVAEKQKRRTKRSGVSR